MAKAPLRLVVTSAQIEAMIDDLAQRHSGNKSAAIRQAIIDAWRQLQRETNERRESLPVARPSLLQDVPRTSQAKGAQA